jgi:epsilon-lactone hydrolase
MLKLHFNSPTASGIRAALPFGRCAMHACLRRALKGARLTGWNWAVEIGTEILKTRLATAFAMPDVNESRRYLDSMLIETPALADVDITSANEGRIRGNWFIAKKAAPRGTLFYLHGGGYSFYPKAYASLIAMITLAVQTRSFALDYRLAPEHRFPAQLEDALDAYRWLLDSGTNPNELVIAGDSAGGNLALVLLLRARDLSLPLPKLAIALSPPTDFEAATEVERNITTLVTNEAFDWIDRRMLIRWANWYCDATERCNPYVSPSYADLRGLPQIYLQAGRAEILYDSIAAFASRAASKGANVVLDSWADMNHDFQIFGELAPQSIEALKRLGEVVNRHLSR